MNIHSNIYTLDIMFDGLFAAINGGMQMPGWFDLYDWPIGIKAKDDRDGKISAAEQIEKVRLLEVAC